MGLNYIKPPFLVEKSPLDPLWKATQTPLQDSEDDSSSESASTVSVGAVSKSGENWGWLWMVDPIALPLDDHRYTFILQHIMANINGSITVVYNYNIYIKYIYDILDTSGIL